MSLLVILGIWVGLSAVCAPLVGIFLAGRRSPTPPRKSSYGIDLHPNSRPRV